AHALGGVARGWDEDVALVLVDDVLRARAELDVEERGVRVAGAALARQANQPARSLALERLAVLAAVVARLVLEVRVGDWRLRERVQHVVLAGAECALLVE